MSKDERLLELCKVLLADEEVVGEGPWAKVVLGGRVEAGSASLSGFCFDAAGEWDAAAPRSRQALPLLRQLNDAMAEDSPGHRRWVACRIVLGVSGKLAADFEYLNPARWDITASTHEKVLAEFAALPAPEGL
jgi:hypothetical protein